MPWSSYFHEQKEIIQWKGSSNLGIFAETHKLKGPKFISRLSQNWRKNFY